MLREVYEGILREIVKQNFDEFCNASSNEISKKENLKELGF